MPPPSLRTGGGAAERAGLENRYSFRAIVGSNPTLSVVWPYVIHFFNNKLIYQESLKGIYLVGVIILGLMFIFWLQF